MEVLIQGLIDQGNAGRLQGNRLRPRSVLFFYRYIIVGYQGDRSQSLTTSVRSIMIEPLIRQSWSIAVYSITS